MLWSGGVGGNIGEVDLGAHRARELDLRLLGRLFETLERLWVFGEIDPFGLLELSEKPLDDTLVEIVATEMGVAVRGAHLKDALAEFEDADIKGATTQVVDGDPLFFLLVETVGECRRGRFVDDPLDGESGDLAGVLGRLALGVIEVGGDGDHRLGDLLSEKGLSIGLELGEDRCTDLLGAHRGPTGEAHGDARGARVTLDSIGDKATCLDRLGVVEGATHKALDA